MSGIVKPFLSNGAWNFDAALEVWEELCYDSPFPVLQKYILWLELS